MKINTCTTVGMVDRWVCNLWCILRWIPVLLAILNPLNMALTKWQLHVHVHVHTLVLVNVQCTHIHVVHVAGVQSVKLCFL